jgi:hypothetical protein
MLALSDEALARLAIGASRVRESERGRWLQDLARKLDPPPRPPMRQFDGARDSAPAPRPTTRMAPRSATGIMTTRGMLHLRTSRGRGV